MPSTLRCFSVVLLSPPRSPARAPSGRRGACSGRAAWPKRFHSSWRRNHARQHGLQLSRRRWRCAINHSYSVPARNCRCALAHPSPRHSLPCAPCSLSMLPGCLTGRLSESSEASKARYIGFRSGWLQRRPRSLLVVHVPRRGHSHPLPLHAALLDVARVPGTCRGACGRRRRRGGCCPCCSSHLAP